MNIKLALLADYANITAEGKLNILGIFDRVNVAQLPAVHPQMQLVLRLEAHPAEADRSHEVEIKMHDPDGQTIFEINGDITPHGTEPGQPLASNQIITINNLRLATTGVHTVIIFVDNDLKAEVPLAVRRAEGAKPPDASGAQGGGPRWDA